MSTTHHHNLNHVKPHCARDWRDRNRFPSTTRLEHFSHIPSLKCPRNWCLSPASFPFSTVSIERFSLNFLSCSPPRVKSPSIAFVPLYSPRSPHGSPHPVFHVHETSLSLLNPSPSPLTCSPNSCLPAVCGSVSIWLVSSFCSLDCTYD